MAFQWYQRDPETGRFVWRETKTNRPPGPGWTASDVPLFDSDPRPETVTVQEDPPLQAERHPATGLFQILPEGQTPAWAEFRSAQRRDHSAARYLQEAAYRAEMAHWYRQRGYPELYPDRQTLGQSEARQYDSRAAETLSLPMAQLVDETWRAYPVPARPPIRRRSSAFRVPLGLPRLSGLRLAGHRPLTSGRRR